MPARQVPRVQRLLQQRAEPQLGRVLPPVPALHPERLRRRDRGPQAEARHQGFPAVAEGGVGGGARGGRVHGGGGQGECGNGCFTEDLTLIGHLLCVSLALFV